MMGKTLTKRTMARISVSVFGLVVAIVCFFKAVTTPIFPFPQQQWANVAYLFIMMFGVALFYWAAFTDFDRNKIERFF